MSGNTSSRIFRCRPHEAWYGAISSYSSHPTTVLGYQRSTPPRPNRRRGAAQTSGSPSIPTLCNGWEQKSMKYYALTKCENITSTAPVPARLESIVDGAITSTSTIGLRKDFTSSGFGDILNPSPPGDENMFSLVSLFAPPSGHILIRG